MHTSVAGCCSSCIAAVKGGLQLLVPHKMDFTSGSESWDMGAGCLEAAYAGGYHEDRENVSFLNGLFIVVLHVRVIGSWSWQ